MGVLCVITFKYLISSNQHFILQFGSIILEKTSAWGGTSSTDLRFSYEFCWPVQCVPASCVKATVIAAVLSRAQQQRELLWEEQQGGFEWSTKWVRWFFKNRWAFCPPGHHDEAAKCVELKVADVTKDPIELITLKNIQPSTLDAGGWRQAWQYTDAVAKLGLSLGSGAAGTRWKCDQVAQRQPTSHVGICMYLAHLPAWFTSSRFFFTVFFAVFTHTHSWL